MFVGWLSKIVANRFISSLCEAKGYHKGIAKLSKPSPTPVAKWWPIIEPKNDDNFRTCPTVVESDDRYHQNRRFGPAIELGEMDAKDGFRDVPRAVWKVFESTFITKDLHHCFASIYSP